METFARRSVDSVEQKEWRLGVREAWVSDQAQLLSDPVRLGEGQSFPGLGLLSPPGLYEVLPGSVRVQVNERSMRNQGCSSAPSSGLLGDPGFHMSLWC